MRTIGLWTLTVLAIFGTLDTADVQAVEKRYLYVGRAPKDRDGFREQVPSLEVHDIDNGHKLVKVIPLTAPAGTNKVYNIRGINACAATRRIYVSHYGSYAGHTTGWLMCLDLVTEKVLWNIKYQSAVDRGAITPDGKKIFMPSGESVQTDYFYVIDALTGYENPAERIKTAPQTHNTICTPNNTRVFMSAFGSGTDYYKYMTVADVHTNQVVKKIGPFASRIRPFTINGTGDLCFVTVNMLLGFQVGDFKTGTVLYTAKPPSTSYPQPTTDVIHCHGIAMTADEKEVWVVDQSRQGLHVFDVSNVPASAPVWKQFIKTHNGREKDSTGKYVYGETGIFGQPGWLCSTIDGKYFYPETGEIIETATKKVLGQLIDAKGNWTHSRFMLEVAFSDGIPVRAGDQFGIGRITGSTPPANQLPKVNITAPASGANFTAPANITISANASDADGSISKVEFFANTALIATENAAPYQFAWSNVAAGSYAIKAVAYDNLGAKTTSAIVNITVSTGNAAPTVSITAPVNGASYNAPANVLIKANATDSNGTISKVDFFANNQLIHTENAAPYEFTWSNVVAGSYVLKAVAQDNAGATKTSATVSITVTAPLSVASFTLVNADSDTDIRLLKDGDTLNFSSLPTRNLNVRANTNPATVGSVRFAYDGNSNYRLENGAPYALESNDDSNYYAWTPSTGAHTLTATPFSAMNAGGSAGQPLTVKFTVTEGFSVTITSVLSGKTYAKASAKTGTLQYTDRSYTVTSLSTALTGGVLIRQANDDKLLRNSMALTLSVNAPATVFVCYDKRATALPAWLNDGTWKLTTETLSTTDTAASPMKVYSRNFAAGSIALGGNMQSPASGAQTNYIPIVRPAVVSREIVPDDLIAEAPQIWEHSGDSDGDGLYDDYELSVGLNAQNVDTDGNGFADEAEFDSGSGLTHFEVQATRQQGGGDANVIVAPLPLSVTRMAGSLKFNQPARSGLSLAGKLNAGPDFITGGAAVILKIGEAAESFSVDAKGRSQTSSASLRIKSPRVKRGTSSNGILEFTIKLKGAAWATGLGIAQDAALKNATLAVPVALNMNGVAHAAEVSALLSSKPGAGAKLKK